MKRTLLVLGVLALIATPFALAGKQAASSLPTPDADTPVVGDHKPPELHISVSPTRLADPDGRMRMVDISGEAEDEGDIDDLYLASVKSDEPGDAADIAGEQIGSFDNWIMLRAESSSRGNGRTYRITFVAVDSAGNRAIDTATVTVPTD